MRWRAEREPILDAVDLDGDLLDIGCANGYLLECLIRWGTERGVNITPHGLDIGPKLIGLARQRLPKFESNFHVGNVWDWNAPRRYRYVYMLCDCLPEFLLADGVRRIMREFVEPGGRFILGAYGSRSRDEPAYDVAGFMRRAGIRVASTAMGGDPRITLFAWIDV